VLTVRCLPLTENGRSPPFLQPSSTKTSDVCIKSSWTTAYRQVAPRHSTSLRSMAIHFGAWRVMYGPWGRMSCASPGRRLGFLLMKWLSMADGRYTCSGPQNSGAFLNLVLRLSVMICYYFVTRCLKTRIPRLPSKKTPIQIGYTPLACGSEQPPHSAVWRYTHLDSYKRDRRGNLFYRAVWEDNT
jgi:hypothetical protein